MRALILFAVAACAWSQVVLTSRTAVVIDSREPSALQKAARDLASDLGKVFGSPVRVLEQGGEASVCVSLLHNLPADVQRPGGSEVLHIRAAAGKCGVVLTGSDLRGAIYAVYEFSSRFLGVDPLWFWTDHEPQRRAKILVLRDTAITDGPPSVRYRGWFINDEDLLTGWKPGTADGTGIALEVWDKVFEAILRLKGNMIVPGTFVFPDEPQVRAAGERGLVITQHHIEVLGLNTYRWPEDREYSFTARPDLLLSAWSHAMRGYAEGQEVIWTLGYRGRHDRPFWSDDASIAKTDAERAQVIRRAIDAQVGIVRAEHRNPYFLMNAWMESVPFIRDGLLKIPDGVTIVWPDDGHGGIRDGGTISSGQGVYYHTAMYNSRANQLTEMVPLERIERELGRMARAGATEYLLINTSDIRPVVMTTRAAMELAWRAQPWVDGGEAARFLDRWSRAEFGEKATPVLSEYYRSYFLAPGRYGNAEPETFSDNAYHTFARHILVDMLGGKAGVPMRYFGQSVTMQEYVQKMASSAAAAEPKWKEARLLANRTSRLIPRQRAAFFQAHVLTQLDIHEYSNRALRNIAEAWLKSDKTAKITAAVSDLKNVVAALQAAETGKWAGFYRRELFTNVRHTLALAEACAAKLQGKPLPAGLPVAVRPVDPYVELKAYQAARRTPL